MERLREEEQLRGDDLRERERRLQGKGKWEKIRNSKFNKWYGLVEENGIPGYLKKG